MEPFFIVMPALIGATIATCIYCYALYERFLAHHAARAIGVELPKEAPVDHALRDRLAEGYAGELADDLATRESYARDTSVFTRLPSVVAFPKDADEVASLVKAVAARKRAGEDVSLTARSAGTDMSGGPLTRSVLAVFTKYMNRLREVGDGYAVAEPGVYYRDFEKATLAKGGQVMPAYPASRELAAMGGIVNNDSGGERTLEYGKTRDYVEELEVVLADGTKTSFGPVPVSELPKKEALPGLEGDIYRKMRALIEENRDLIERARPKVSKNSAGYALWDVEDSVKKTFDLAQLVTGAQGTLALTTAMRLRLVKEQRFRSMLVIFLKDLDALPEIVRRVLPFNPESFESYDDHTFRLAIRFLPGMLSHLGLARALRLGLSFLPEVGMILRGGVPKLVLMAEFSEDSAEDALHVAERAQASLASLNLETRINQTEEQSEKYWMVRRESFALLRAHAHGLYAAPFIDDFVVPPDSYPEFLPQLSALLDEYKDRFIYTVAGHVGNGNFHVIPLMDLSKPEVRSVILELAPKVYDLVIAHGGTTTGEHNDGIIRTPYLGQLFGERMVRLFEETKRIFDPEGILNPGKKVGGTFEDVKDSMLTHA
jgi:FAD/FMN-containing dehydrogenase